jgi:hypothetical protein
MADVTVTGTGIMVTTRLGKPGEVTIEYREALVRTTRLMVEHTQAEPDVEKRGFYARASTLCAHAAAEGILNEWLLNRDRAAYQKLVVDAKKKLGLVRLAELTVGMIGGTVPADLADLSSHKNALTHPQPEHPRTRAVGGWLLSDGPQRALGVVEDLYRQFFPGGQAAPVAP